MNFDIEFQWACFSITTALCRDLDEPRFVVAIERGSNGLVEIGVSSGRPRLARSWSIGMIGTHRQVMRRATHAAAACESGSLRPGGRRCTPEAYISRVRRLLARPHDIDATERHIALAISVCAIHPVAQLERTDGFTYYEHEQLHTPCVKLIPRGPAQWACYFALVDPFLDDFSLHPANLGEVQGLSRS